MTAYRRNFIPGGCFFFTVNLADRRLRLLTEMLKPCALPFVKPVNVIHSRSTQWSYCLIISMRSGHCLKAIGILRRAGG
jgi:hypothetical protein